MKHVRFGPLPYAVVTLGTSDQQPFDHPQRRRDFLPGIERIHSRLLAQKFKGGFIAWHESLPQGAPPHVSAPFGFKPFCMLEAARLGYDRILWLDASVDIKGEINDLFRIIEEVGFLIFRERHSVGAFCKDEALGPLGITRSESFLMPSCWACALGLDLRAATSRTFLARWADLASDGITFPGPKWSGIRGYPPTASSDPRVKGHRFDQTAASVLAHQLGMSLWHSRDFFDRYLSNDRQWIKEVDPGGPDPA